MLYLVLAEWGYWALVRTPIHAIPDLSDNQVIVFSDWPGRYTLGIYQDVRHGGGDDNRRHAVPVLRTFIS